MLPDLALLLALLLGFHWFEEADGHGMPDILQSLLGTAAATLVAAVLCRLSADRTARRVEEDGAKDALAGSRAPMLYPLLAWLAAGFAFRWDELVAAVVPGSWFIVPHAVFFLPLAVTTIFAWIAVDRAESAIVARTPSRRRAILGGLRRNALVLVPVGLVLVVHRTFLTLEAAGVPGIRRFLATFRAFPDLVYAAMVLGTLAAIIVAPGIVRRILRATPLAEGAARTAITRLLESLGVRVRDVLLWSTEGRIQNAMTVGLLGRSRYVIVTDALLATFPPTEVLAVVAHEAGHVRLRHLVLHATALVSVVLVFLSLGPLFAGVLSPSSQTTLAIVCLWFGWFGLVGRLSRRFEREADAFAADHAGDLTPTEPPAAFSGLDRPLPFGATQTLRALGRASRAGSASYRHGSPALRMSHVADYATHEEVRRAHDRTGRRVRFGIVALAVAAVGLTFLRMPSSLDRGRALLAFDDALEASRVADSTRREASARARENDRRAYDLFIGVVERADARGDDPEMRRLAAIAEYDAADRAMRGLDDEVAARRGLLKTLDRCAKLDDDESAPLRFAALIDLGRLSLWQTNDALAGVAEAKRRLSTASGLLGGDAGERYRRARLRLLESSIALRSTDRVEVDRARRDLAVQAVGTGDADPNWTDLADDARSELARVPIR